MASSSRVSILALFLLLSPIAVLASEVESESVPDDGPKHVLTLDHSNFTEIVGKHNFIVVEFYAPWCGHCKSLEPEYEKAAAELSKADPPIVLAKVDANDEANKDLASKYEVRGFPTLKIFRNGGKNTQEYKGPRESLGIVDYLKKQQGPASTEISSAEDAENAIDTNKVSIVGVFSKTSGEEFDNFISVAEKLRADYQFAHTLESKFLPRGVSTAKKPFIRLLKPFDELFVDSQDFNVDAIEKFIEEVSIPMVTIFNKDPNNHPYVIKFFNGPQAAKAMLFVNFSSGNFEEFKSKYQGVAETYKKNGISFLLGDLDSSQGAFQYFGLKQEQAPLIIIQASEGKQKYLKTNVEPTEVAAWFKDYVDGGVKPFVKSEPIPEANDEPVKVVVHDSFHDVVLKSGKNVLLEFYAPWCGHCKKLAPILDEVAVSFKNDPSVVIAKFDATANDVPGDEFDIKGYPTLYFVSSTGKILQYEGDRSKEDIINYINNHKDKDGAEIESEAPSDSPKDEL